MASRHDIACAVLIVSQEVMAATIEKEKELAHAGDFFAVFRGRNLIRFIIASWPKITQQLVGLTVFNTYATYFCDFVHRDPKMSFTDCFLQSSMLATRILSLSL